jgi:hypothetical protein
MPQIARLLMPPAHAPMHDAQGWVRGCGLLAPPDTPDPPPLPEPQAALPRADRAAVARQVAGTCYTVAQQARMPRPTGGATARRELRADPHTALAELVAIVDHGGTLADFARRRGLAYSTAHRWIASDFDRARAYEAARDARFIRQADEIIRIADESTAETPAELARDRLRISTRMLQAERLMPGRYGRRLTEAFADRQARKQKLTDAELAEVLRN